MGLTSTKEKQKIYAQEYLLTNDPLQSYVKAGYSNTIEEAKKSGNYKTPLKSKLVQDYIKSLTSTKKDISKEIKERPQKINVKKELLSYYNDSELGLDGKKFLLDFIHDSNIYPKDRLTAFELLVKFTNGYYNKSNQSKVNVGVIFNEDYR